MEVNGYEELTEVRHDLESESIIADIYDPDLFHLSAPLDNETMNFFILDELGKEVVTFDLSDTTDVYDYFGDDLDPDEEFGSNDHLAIPEMLGCENVLLIYDENKPRYNSLKWYLEIIGLDFEDTIKSINSMKRHFK